MRSIIPFTAMTCLFVVNHALGADFEANRIRNWHQWRGPRANGTAPLANPPLRWSETENVKWKAEIPGKGSATPIVWDDRVFVVAAVQTGREAENVPAEPEPSRREEGRRRGFRSTPPRHYYRFLVLCHDRRTGKELWRHLAVEEVPHEGHHSTGTFASCSPITDGESVYVSFGSRGIYCYAMDGKPRWKRDLGDLRIRNAFGEGGSPALRGETLIVPWDHEDQSSVVALNTKDGSTLWKVERDEPTTWATPLIVDAGDRTQVVLHGATRVRAYDIEDGRLIWECGGQASNPIASPLAADGLVYCTTGRRGYAVSAMPLTAKGDISGSEQVAWRRDDSGAYVSSPLLHEGLLYHIKGLSSILSCLDAKTGEVVFGPERLPGLREMYASPVAARGRIYLTDRSGTTLVIEPGRELKVLATNKLNEGIDASFALVGKELFARGEKHLYCIEAQ